MAPEIIVAIIAMTSALAVAVISTRAPRHTVSRHDEELTTLRQGKTDCEKLLNLIIMKLLTNGTLTQQELPKEAIERMNGD